MTIGHPARRLVLLVVVPIVVAAGVLVAAAPAPPGPSAPALAPAADTSMFRADNIITDAVFFDSGSMSASQIQKFLDTKGANCVDGEQKCLKSFRQNTITEPADAYCSRTYQGASAELASTIIAKVAQACGINPRVILVMLQKETSISCHFA